MLIAYARWRFQLLLRCGYAVGIVTRPVDSEGKFELSYNRNSTRMKSIAGHG